MRRLRPGYTLAWVALIAAFGLVEGSALIDARPGDTASEHVWALLDAFPVAGLGIAVFLLWLGRHFLGRGR